LALQLRASYVAASIVPIRPSEITVEGLSGTISDVNLKLNGYSHPFADDVAVQVVGPDGTSVLLMSDVGATLASITSTSHWTMMRRTPFWTKGS
jgi:hypothetical protein